MHQSHSYPCHSPTALPSRNGMPRRRTPSSRNTGSSRRNRQRAQLAAHHHVQNRLRHPQPGPVFVSMRSSQARRAQRCTSNHGWPNLETLRSAKPGCADCSRQGSVKSGRRTAGRKKPPELACRLELLLVYYICVLAPMRFKTSTGRLYRGATSRTVSLPPMHPVAACLSSVVRMQKILSTVRGMYGREHLAGLGAGALTAVICRWCCCDFAHELSRLRDTRCKARRYHIEQDLASGFRCSWLSVDSETTSRILLSALLTSKGQRRSQAKEPEFP